MKKVLLVALLSVAALSAHAQSIVAEYNFTAGNASVDTDPTSVASAITDIGLNSSINAAAGNPAPSIQAIAEQITNSASAPPANATTDYYTFTLTPLTGVSLDFTTLRVDAATLTNVAVGTLNTYTVSLQTSLNSFATNISTYTVSNNTTFTNLSFDLSSFAATTGTTPVEFRLVIRDDNASTQRGILLDNIVLSANVIPEPSTYAMLGVGAVLLAGAKRFRRKKS